MQNQNQSESTRRDSNNDKAMKIEDDRRASHLILDLCTGCFTAGVNKGC